MKAEHCTFHHCFLTDLFNNGPTCVLLVVLRWCLLLRNLVCLVIHQSDAMNQRRKGQVEKLEYLSYGMFESQASPVEVYSLRLRNSRILGLSRHLNDMVTLRPRVP